MNKRLHQWENWWCRTVPPHSMAIIRIAFGLFLIVEAITYLPAIPALFSDHGIVIPLWAHLLPDSLRFLLEPPSVPVASIIVAIYFLCCTLLALGYLTRTALIGLIILFLYYWQLSFHFFPSSYHRLFFFVLVVLLFSRSDRTFSLRMLRTRGSWSAWEPISILPQRLLALQMTATYIGVGWQKMWLPDWQSGRIFYYSFIGKWGSPMAFALARILPDWFYEVLNWTTRVLEFFLPFLLWIPSWRILAVIAGTMFHVIIALLLGIWWFLVLPPMYILFLDPEAFYAWLRRHFPRIAGS